MNRPLFFSNLKPNDDEYPVCNALITDLSQMAPSNANIDAAIKKLADGTYHTVIAIHAIGERFQSEAKTNSFVTSLKQAQRSMFSILKEWKVDRFKIQPLKV